MKLIPKESAFEKDTKIQCPVCENDFVHVYRADLRDGNDKYEAIKEVRGDAVIVKMYCENGHKFRVIIGEHKGNCYIFSDF